MKIFNGYVHVLHIPHGIEVTVDYAALKGEYDKIIIKVLSVANNGIIPKYYFRIPYEVVHNIRKNNTSNDKNILLDDRQIAHSQPSNILHETQTGYEHLIADSLRHDQTLLPLLADRTTFPQIGRFQLLTTT
jgi:hypothetical protein